MKKKYNPSGISRIHTLLALERRSDLCDIVIEIKLFTMKKVLKGGSGQGYSNDNAWGKTTDTILGTVGGTNLGVGSGGGRCK
jgi:hypothetical protein